MKTTKPTTTETKHTPGPWKVRDGVNEHFIDSQETVCLAVINSLDDSRKELREAKANARLIAAAPELLAALKAFLDCQLEVDLESHDVCGDCAGIEDGCALCLAREAIAKSEGE